MELDNFFKSVMPVADYFDQSDMLVAVSRQTNFHEPTLICWPFRSTASVHLPRCTKTFARPYSTFCRRKKTRKRYSTESLASGTALTTFLVVLSALKLHRIRVKQGTMLQLQHRQTQSNLRLSRERKWTVTSAGTSSRWRLLMNVQRKAPRQKSVHRKSPRANQGSRTWFLWSADQAATKQLCAWRLSEWIPDGVT